MITRAWAMPSRHTFEVSPIRDFVERWTRGAAVVVDPFAGRSDVATHQNDLAWPGGKDAIEYIDGLIAERLIADVVILDPPYSPRQISEVYKSVGRTVGVCDTQNARLYAAAKFRLTRLLRPGGVALTFGWNSSGFGKSLGFAIEEILMVCHGSAHNDTICVAERLTQSGLEE